MWNSCSCGARSWLPDTKGASPTCPKCGRGLTPTSMDSVGTDAATVEVAPTHPDPTRGGTSTFMLGATPTPEARIPGGAERIGGWIAERYELRRKIGEGGMGTVYAAHQHAPVKRDVALKVIKAGMDSKAVLARFEAERQTLAMMDHPNIAHVLDAGSTAAGSPFFVMEFVDGVPINKFADEHRLTVADRLRVFIQVCQGLQHAHQKGIIHRDIKPSNVLVAMVDGRPVPKVIDFGVAKATGPGTPGAELLTGFGTVVGTPEYMSPEQATLDGRDVDTRSDVYSLGVLLYELLTGSTPVSRNTLEHGAVLEILRVVREIDPPRPSTRLSTAETRSEIARRRSADPTRLTRQLQGELDWITLKALEKDAARRYDSASALAADLQRYLANEPVHAAPPSTAYRLRKLLARHRGKAVAALLVSLSLVFGMVAFAWQARVAGIERDRALAAGRAEAAQRRAADEQRDRALNAESQASARADELRQVADFQAEMLEQIDPVRSGQELTELVTARLTTALGKLDLSEQEVQARLAAFSSDWSRAGPGDVTRQLLDEALMRPTVAALDTKFKDQPLIDAQLRQVLARRYRQFGLYAEAMPLQERALETRRHLLGEADRGTLESQTEMATLLILWGKLEEAEAVSRAALERTRQAAGDDATETYSAQDLLAACLSQLDRVEEAETLARQAVAGLSRIEGDTSHAAIGAGSTLASILQRRGKLDEAEACFHEWLDKSRTNLGAENESTLSLLNNWGTLLQTMGRLEEAEAAFRELEDVHRRRNGENYPSRLVALGNLGFVLSEQGKLDEAERCLRESTERRRHVLGPEHPTTLFGIHDLGILLARRGHIDEAQPLIEEAYRTRLMTLGATHEATLASLHALAFVLQDCGKAEVAITILEEAILRLRKEVGDEHPSTIRARHRLGALHLAAGNSADAEVVLRATAAEAAAVLGPTDPTTLDCTDGHFGALWGLGRTAEAESVMREALEIRRSHLGDQNLSTLMATEWLGRLLSEKDESLAEATDLLRVALVARRGTLGDDDPTTLELMNHLGALLQHQGRIEEAEPLLRETLERRRRVRGPDHEETLLSVRNMCIMLQDLGRFADGEPFLREELAICQRLRGADHPETINSLIQLGYALLGMGKHAQAAETLRDALDRSTRIHGAKTPPTLVAATYLGAALVGAGAQDEARVHLSSAGHLLRENPFQGSEYFSALLVMKLCRATLDSTPQVSELAPLEAELIDAHATFERLPYLLLGEVDECVTTLVDFYTTWDQLAPSAGHAGKAAEWQARLERN